MRRDRDFDMCDQDETNYMPIHRPAASSPQQAGGRNYLGDEDVDMNTL